MIHEMAIALDEFSKEDGIVETQRYSLEKFKERLQELLGQQLNHNADLIAEDFWLHMDAILDGINEESHQYRSRHAFSGR